MEALRAALARQQRIGVRWAYPGSTPLPEAAALPRTAREEPPAGAREERTVELPVVTPAAAPGARETLAVIREDLGDCTRCALSGGRKNIVFGVGNPRARLMFVGEGPGADEDEQGEPFVGKAGQLLDKIIEAIGLSRSDVYIANVVKCRPPGNRNPEPEEIASCLPFLERQIASIAPAVLVTLGNVPTKTLLGVTTGIVKTRGRWQAYRGIPVMPTFHPAYLLRTPGDKRLVWEDMQQVAARYNENLPPDAKPATPKGKG